LAQTELDNRIISPLPDPLRDVECAKDKQDAAGQNWPYRGTARS
jgi:hypothetical protein